MKKVPLIITTTFGLEAIVRRELEDMGFAARVVVDGRLATEARIEDIPQLNIHLRCADRVLIQMGEFEAKDFDQLFEGVKSLPWERWLTPEASVNVLGKCVRSQLMSVRSCQSITHKALIERLKQKYKIQRLPEEGIEYTVQVSLLKDRALITLDTSGDGLHKRGYRMHQGEAPLRENLAAALVMLSFWQKGRVLIDPMCGSGTILIEAAMLMRNIPPGLYRHFISEQWPVMQKQWWQEAREKAQQAIRPSESELRIFGYDIDIDRIHDARKNAQKMGLEKDIVFECKSLNQLVLNQSHGIVISNPPYGIKLGHQSDLKKLYQELFAVFKDKPGWSCYILTADTQFPLLFRQQKPHKIRKLFNGTIEVQYYQYYGKKP